MSKRSRSPSFRPSVCARPSSTLSASASSARPAAADDACCAPAGRRAWLRLNSRSTRRLARSSAVVVGVDRLAVDRHQAAADHREPVVALHARRRASALRKASRLLGLHVDDEAVRRVRRRGLRASWRSGRCAAAPAAPAPAGPTAERRDLQHREGRPRGDLARRQHQPARRARFGHRALQQPHRQPRQQREQRHRARRSRRPRSGPSFRSADTASSSATKPSAPAASTASDAGLAARRRRAGSRAAAARAPAAAPAAGRSRAAASGRRPGRTAPATAPGAGSAAFDQPGEQPDEDVVHGEAEQHAGQRWPAAPTPANSSA